MHSHQMCFLRATPVTHDTKAFLPPMVSKWPSGLERSEAPSSLPRNIRQGASAPLRAIRETAPLPAVKLASYENCLVVSAFFFLFFCKFLGLCILLLACVFRLFVSFFLFFCSFFPLFFLTSLLFAGAF